MPYITKTRREQLDAGGPLGCNQPADVGELTYVLTRALNDYLADAVERKGGLSYGVIAQCLAALEGARADLERRVLTPLEEVKQVFNGDVWSPHVLTAAHGRDS